MGFVVVGIFGICIALKVWFGEFFESKNNF
jgi:hypothetical protein